MNDTEKSLIQSYEQYTNPPDLNKNLAEYLKKYQEQYNTVLKELQNLIDKENQDKNDN